MKKYLCSSLKYLLKLTLLMMAIYAAMYATGTLGITTDELLGTKGVVLVVAIVALAAAYPSYGFVRRSSKASMVDDREKILSAMRQNGYSLCRESGDQMVFRASSPAKRIWYLGDDKITVTANTNGGVELYGIRKEVVQAEFRITSHLIGGGQL